MLPPVDTPQPTTAREKVLEGLFAEFVALGADRTYGKLGRKHGIEASELVRHARKFLWPDRINALQIQHNEETSTESEFTKADPENENVNKLHLSRLRALQMKAYAHLEKCAFDKPETALRMLVDCMKLQREILGLSKDKDEDLRATMMRRLDEMSRAQPPAGAPEFKFDPDFKVPPAPEIKPEDGPEGNPAPPSGGDHAE